MYTHPLLRLSSIQDTRSMRPLCERSGVKNCSARIKDGDILRDIGLAMYGYMCFYRIMLMLLGFGFLSLIDTRFLLKGSEFIDVFKQCLCSPIIPPSFYQTIPLSHHPPQALTSPAIANPIIQPSNHPTILKYCHSHHLAILPSHYLTIPLSHHPTILHPIIPTYELLIVQ